MSESKDHEWLLLRERGEDVSHIPASTRAKYDQLAKLFEELPGATPSPGWKLPILAALDEPPAQNGPANAPDGPPVRDISTARRRPRYRTWVIVGGLATTAAFTIALTLCNHAIEEHRPSVAAVESRDNLAHMSVSKDPTGTAEIRRGNKPHRSGSDSVSIGDTLVLHVKAAPPFELRVYGDTGEPLARCSETQGCSLENDGNVRQFRLELELRASGDVRAVLFTGASIPDAFQDLNTDVETAQRAKVDAHQIAVVHVQ